MNSTMRLKIFRMSIFLLIGILAIIAFAYAEELRLFIKIALNSKWLTAVVGIYVFACAIVNRIFVRTEDGPSGAIYSQFGKFTDFIFATFAYVPASAASIALVRGLFMQHYFNAKYFDGFDQYDLISILVVSAFLLYYSLQRSTSLLIAVIQNVDASPVKKAQPPEADAMQSV
jgi:hypothetical protein